MYLGMSQSEANEVGFRGTDEGGKLKETGTSHWNSPNTGATNESGFSALPGGDRNDVGSYGFMGCYATFWSSTVGMSSHTWIRLLSYDSSEVAHYSFFKKRGYSVRCVRDE